MIFSNIFKQALFCFQFSAWVMGWLLCKAVPYIQGVAVCASVYSLVAISTDRYAKIKFSCHELDFLAVLKLAEVS